MSISFTPHTQATPEVRVRRAQFVRTLGLLLWLALAWQLARGCAAPRHRSGPAPPPAWLHIDVGRDPAWRLTLLPGIGSRRAYDIVADRRRWGPPERFEDLQRIHGIGPVTLKHLREAEGFCLLLSGRPVRSHATPAGEGGKGASANN